MKFRNSTTEFQMSFLFVKKDFIAIIMYSKRQFVYASVDRWTINALRLMKSSLGMVRLVSLLRRGPVLCSHRSNQFRFSIF